MRRQADTGIKMNDALFNEINAEYDKFYRELLRSGRLPMWSTGKGFWNAAISSEIYRGFGKIRLWRFKNFLDLGSGDGKVTLIAALFCQNAEGIEVDEFLHNKANEMKMKFRIENAKFHNKDFFEHNLTAYDILFLNPDAPMDRGLELKLLKEMKGRLVHYGYHFHPRYLKNEARFVVNGNLVSLYSR